MKKLGVKYSYNRIGGVKNVQKCIFGKFDGNSYKA